MKNNEDVLTAIKRELLEEMGINFSDHELLKKFVLETIYDDYYDFRVRGYRARCTITTYFYGETKQDIDTSRMNLTMEEINEEFKISFVSKEDLIKIINTDHSSAFNGRYFDEENKIVYENIIGGLKQ